MLLEVTRLAVEKCFRSLLGFEFIDVAELLQDFEKVCASVSGANDEKSFKTWVGFNDF